MDEIGASRTWHGRAHVKNTLLASHSFTRLSDPSQYLPLLSGWGLSHFRCDIITPTAGAFVRMIHSEAHEPNADHPPHWPSITASLFLNAAPRAVSDVTGRSSEDCAGSSIDTQLPSRHHFMRARNKWLMLTAASEKARGVCRNYLVSTAARAFERWMRVISHYIASRSRVAT